LPGARVIPWIKSAADFPSVETALHEPSGLLCMGGTLDPAMITAAYRRGIFPWYSEGQPILWWSPDPRMVLFPAEFKVSHSLAKTIRSNKYEVRFDTAFAEVIRHCAAPRAPGHGTWITPEMQAAYIQLHTMGVAHSAEAWQRGPAGDELVGGLYGIAIGRMFYGESMFTRATDASKVAFAALMKKITADDFALVDCQQETRHLASFGARPITRREFTKRVQELITSSSASQSNWTPATPIAR
jgi:leucyl/phenylalanyl-tRNA---protein transferase